MIKVKSRSFRQKNGDMPFNASGVVQVGPRRFVFVDNHDSAALFEFDLDDRDEIVGKIRRRPLLGISEDQLQDPEGLALVGVDGEPFLVVASSMSVRSGSREEANDGLVRVRYAAEGGLETEAMDGFRDWLLSHEPALAVASDRRPDDDGLNIEGIAWDSQSGTLVFGQRGPAEPGFITLISVPLDVRTAPWTVASLGAPSLVRARVPKPNARYGIRDVTYDEQTGNFLILLGRALSRDDLPFVLCTWNGRSDDVQLLDVDFHRSMKPEGIALISDDSHQVIVVYDDGGYALLHSDAEWWQV